ncbi:Bracovirus particle protein 17a [Microplitis demolitor]|uniref:Bracovirus particle protein 17a n=1 Tax=Microplitis demolitor TaxID=69319 RepID=UPI0004400181|nr:Bracovirus particle protein 17a [Microplitis demolitor]KAG6558541.1 Bracovirus particle protein 17a [Microplitis demolitor]
MDFFANPFQGLLMTATKSGGPFEVVDDYDYNLEPNGNFAGSYEGFKQRDYVQLPDELVDARSVANKKFVFKSNQSVRERSIQEVEQQQLKQKLRAALDDINVNAIDDRQSVSSMDTLQTYQQNDDGDEIVETPEDQSYSPSLVSASFDDAEHDGSNDVFKKPFSNSKRSKRSNKTSAADKSDTYSQMSDDKTIYSNEGSDIRDNESVTSVADTENYMKYLGRT